MKSLLTRRFDNRLLPFILLPIVVLMIAVAMSGCSTPPVTKSPPIEESVAIVTPNAWGAERDAIAINALQKYGNSLLSADPKDAKEWCPTWPNVDKRQFYAALLANMAKRESNFKPSLEYREGFKNGAGETVVSVGLLQVSYESCRAYGVKGATTESLKSVEQNLECAVRILNKWVPQDGHIAKDKLGGARYWSVLRPGNSKEYIRTQMRSFCK